ncbi:MAG: hypothetical protein IJ821_06205 [Lachnospiraceae bacterium]|nr:hypothetical protein [Lachnospiraceae bacterium]
MKTIQEVLRGLDPIKIENGYFYEHEWQIWELPPDKFDGMTIGELKERRSKRFQDFLSSLIDMEPVQPEDGKQGILFLTKTKTMNARVCADRELCLAHVDDILNATSFAYEDFSCYDFSFSPREECISFRVADNKLTQDNLLDVAIQFVYVLSCFGYDYEDVQKVMDDIDQSIERAEEDIKAGRTYTVEETMDHLAKEFGFPKEEVYPKEKELKSNHLKAEIEYNLYCRTIELERIKEYLHKHMNEVYPNAQEIVVPLDEPCPMGALTTDVDGLLQAIEESKQKEKR